MKVVWSDQALARLVEIKEYVAQDSPAAAARLVASLVDRGDSLGRLPRRGGLLPGFEPTGLRELIERSYRIVYRVKGATVEIVTVFEGHRLPPGEDLT